MARVWLEWLRRLVMAVLTIALFLVVGGAVIVIVLYAVGPSIQKAPLEAAEAWRAAAQQVIVVGGMLFATWLVAVRFLKGSWREWGWRTEDGGVLRQFGRGTLMGAVMATLAIGLALLGGARLHFEEGLGAYVGSALPLMFVFLAAALAEELMFRGFPLQRMSQVLGPRTATIVFALAFGVAHLKNPAATLFAAVNIALAGIWLSVAFFSSGGMGLAWGLHFGWNAMLALGFDAPVSGIMLHLPGPEYAVGRYAWLDGGRFGPEGGVVATIAILGGTAYLLKDRMKDPMRLAA